MAQLSTPTPLGARVGHVAWVVPDIHAAERFFCETMGKGYSVIQSLRLPVAVVAFFSAGCTSAAAISRRRSVSPRGTRLSGAA